MRRYSGEPVAAGCAREVYSFLVPFHNSALDYDSQPVMTQAAHANYCMPRGGRPQSQPLADARLCRQDRHSRQVQCRRAVPNRIDLNQISFSRARSSFRHARLCTLCNRCPRRAVARRDERERAHLAARVDPSRTQCSPDRTVNCSSWRRRRVATRCTALHHVVQCRNIIGRSSPPARFG